MNRRTEGPKCGATMNLFGKAKAKPQAQDTSGTILKLRETLDSLDKRWVSFLRVL